MRRRFFHFLCFLLASGLEVQVKAKGTDTLLMDPVHCLAASGQCAVKALMDRQVIHVEGSDLVLAKGAIVRRDSESHYHLVSGVAVLRSEESSAVSTEFAGVGCPGPCEVLLEKVPGEIQVSALTGEAVIAAKGSRETLSLPPGYTVRIGAIGTNGKAEVEIPRASVFEPTIKKWNSASLADREKFKKMLTVYRENWRQAVDKGSDMHLDLANRYIASVEQERRSREERRRIEESKKAEMRKLFRRMNYLEE